MGIISVTQEEAENAHKSEYNDNKFIVAPFQRSGFYNFFPFSMVYGLSDIGSWYGLISTDGDKVVITKSTLFSMSKVKKKWTFQKSEIVSSVDGTFSFRMVLNKKISGLTMGGMGGLMKSVLFLVTIWSLSAPFWIVAALGGKHVNLMILDDLKTDEEIKKLLLSN